MFVVGPSIDQAQNLVNIQSFLKILKVKYLQGDSAKIMHKRSEVSHITIQQLKQWYLKAIG